MSLFDGDSSGLVSESRGFRALELKLLMYAFAALKSRGFASKVRLRRE